MIKESDRDRIAEQALRRGGIGWRAQAGELGERREVAEAQVAGDAEDRRVEIVTRAVHAVQERRQLHLSNGDRESDRLEPRLQELLQRGLTAAHGQQLEGDVPSGELSPRRVRRERYGGRRDVARHVGRYGAVGLRAEPVQVGRYELAAIDGEYH